MLIKRDNDSGNGVAPDKLAGTVHRPVEVGLLRDLFAAPLCLLLVDDPGVQVGVDRHLPARHAIQRKSRRHFTNACCPFGDDDKLNHDNDDEDNHANDNLVAGDKVAERLDHSAARFQVVAFGTGQDQAGRGDVQDQPAKGRRQQQRREDAELQRRSDIDGRQQHDHGD